MKNIITFLLLTILIANASAQTRVILEKRNGVYYIPCQVNGLNMKFVFDSGASDVTISLAEAIFMLKNNYLSKDNILGTEYYQIANGEIQEGTKIILKSINIGGYVIFNVEASIVHNNYAPLLLGQSALSKLGKFSFDYSTNSLIIGNDNSNINTFGCVSGNCNQGYGTFTTPNGDKYIGEFKDDKLNGQGTYTFSNGEKYVGEFKDGKKNGQGTYTYSGSIYVGEYKDGKMNGQGTYTFSNGDKYVGEFKDDNMNGQATYTYSNGDKYVGELKDGEKNGQGTVIYSNGEKYVGEFKDGKKNGQGTIIFSDGSKLVEYYINGVYDINRVYVK